MKKVKMLDLRIFSKKNNLRTIHDSLHPILTKTRVKMKKVKMLDLGIFLKFSFENKSGWIGLDRWPSLA